MENIVMIEAELTTPPSAILSVRSVLLFVICYLKQNPIFVLDEENKDYYWKWLKDNYLLDFGKDVIFKGDAIEAKAIICTSSKTWAEWDNGDWEKIVETDRIAPENAWTILRKLS